MAVSDEKQSGESSFDLGCQLLKAGKPADAAQTFQTLLAQNPNHAEAYSKLGVCYILQDKIEKAQSLFEKAIKIDPLCLAAYNNLALALSNQEEYERAVYWAEKGLAVDDQYLPLYSTIAFALKPLARVQEALEYLRQAASIDGEDIQVLFNLASLLIEDGQTEDAKSFLEKVLSKMPQHTEVHRMLSLITKYDGTTPHLAQLKQIAQMSGLPPQNLSDIHFALGKAYEDMRDFENAAAHYKTANKAYRSLIQYNHEQERTFFEDIKRTFTAEFIQGRQLKPCDKNLVFIVGMPRSGTSLIEQILASHPEIHGAGELNFLDAVQFRDQKIIKEGYAQSIGVLKVENFESMANTYLQKISNIASGQNVVTDKMPHNFRYLGLIKILFPNAKIVHCVRDFRDVALSIFKTRFVGQLEFAYDMREISAYYKLYEDLMRHWQTVMPDGFFEVNYEHLVDDIEPSIKALLEYCDLPWDDRCLSFHETKRAVTTASAQQVRKPLYKSAVGYWKNYESYLGALRENS